MSTFYITTPIYYVNDVPHLGHAYTTIAADALARFQRQSGRRVRFLTGTDEHGQKIEKAAREQGLRPQQLADRVVERFARLWERLNITHDDFIRTTEPRHQRVVQRLFERVREHGDIYLGKYEGWYCTGCEEYYTESQFEDGRCPIHKRPLERLQEESYFFRMSRYGQALLRHFEQHPEFVLPDFRRNEVVSFVREGLRDLSVSRTSFSWGIPVPGDERHVIYVWFDALTNYISALGWDGQGGAELFADFWPAVHFIGKDILRFHAVYWPSFLLSAGVELPRTVFAHGWWTVEGEKMSKSLRNVVEPYALIDAYGADAVRYFLLREVPFGLDGDFSHGAMIGRINAELANDLGNLLRRSVAMVEKYCGGLAPAPSGRTSLEGSLVQAAHKAAAESARHFTGCAFHQAVGEIWEFVRRTNRYIDEAGPWSLHQEGKTERLHTVMAHILEALRQIAVMCWPVIPQAAEKMLGHLGLGGGEAQLKRGGIEEFGALPLGTRVRQGEPLFPRIDQQRAAEIRAGFQGGKNQRAVSAAKGDKGMPTIDIDHFRSVDLRVGVVKSAQRIKGSQKLIVMQMDLGEPELRQVVAGIGQAYPPEKLLGKRLLVVANLQPVKLMGVESRGMVLAAGPGGENIVLAEFAEGVPAGEPVH